MNPTALSAKFETASRRANAVLTQRGTGMHIVYTQGFVWYCAAYDRADDLKATDCDWLIPFSFPWLH
jgi:hypothetical protein